MCKPPLSPELLLEGRACVSCQLCSVAWRLKLMLLMLPPICPVVLLPAAAQFWCSLGNRPSFALTLWPLHTVLLRCILQASGVYYGWSFACTACTVACKGWGLHLCDKHHIHALAPPRLPFGLLFLIFLKTASAITPILPSKPLWAQASIPHICHGCTPPQLHRN